MATKTAKKKDEPQDLAGQALYRKYRPQSFKEVLGQDQVVKVLEGALKKNNVAHAYLFAGPRGTGKTSVARLVAKELGVADKDLYEIDGASYRGIDAVRDLQETIDTLPFESDYKLYIIDEVHMLTKEAFNAFLKTLEEPPAHVRFVLATTEMHKVPDTIISRCEVHHFKKPSRKLLKKHVVDIAKKEGFTLEPTAADLVALLAEGSFRDAQGILQKIISSSQDTKVSVDEVALVTGAPQAGVVNDILEALDVGDSEKALVALGGATENSIDMKTLATLLLEKVRAVLLFRFAKGMHEELSEEFGEEDMEVLDKIAHNKETRITSETLSVLLDAYGRIGYSYMPSLPLELAIIELTGEE